MALGVVQLLGISIGPYVWVGILLILLGVGLSYLPLIGKRVGITLIIIGIILAVGIDIFKSLIGELFQNKTFVAVLIGVVALILIMVILFPKSTKELIRK